MNQAVVITQLTKQDLPGLVRLFRGFWGESSNIDRMRQSLERIAANPAYVLIAAKKKGELLGFGMGVVCEELYGDCRPFMVIEDLIVDTNHRRCGIGEKLMRELEARAREQDCCQIIFVSEADRTGACRFYESIGYESEPYNGFKKKLD